nr:hypothetical protein [Tanacetum cinerariifolium]
MAEMVKEKVCHLKKEVKIVVFDSNKDEVVPKVDYVSLIDGVFEGAFGEDGDEDFVVGECVVVSSFSLVKEFSRNVAGSIEKIIDCTENQKNTVKILVTFDGGPLNRGRSQIYMGATRGKEYLHARSLRHFHHHHHHHHHRRWDERRMVDQRRIKKKWRNDLFSCHNPFESFALVERFGEDVGDIIFERDFFDDNMSFLDIIPKKVVTNFDVFSPRVLHRVFANVNRAFIFAHDQDVIESNVVVDESLFHP